MKKWYRVIIEADFVTKDVSPEAIRNKLKRIIAREGFEQKNFEIEITRVRKEEVDEHQNRQTSRFPSHAY